LGSIDGLDIERDQFVSVTLLLKHQLPQTALPNGFSLAAAPLRSGSGE